MKEKLKIYISTDIEGITGVVHDNETVSGKPDYEYFRKIMAEETNAAVEAAFEAGATDVLVRDAHGSALNILPDKLNENARLVRNWAESPICMMEGLDSTFDAVLFVGYHAKSNTPDATLKHTMSFKIDDLQINGLSMAEASLNALIAGHFGVPVVFIAGDKAICDYAMSVLPGITTVAVKEGLGEACITLHPEKSKKLIREGVLGALENRKQVKPFRMRAPITMDIHYRFENSAFRAQFFPGTERIDTRVVRFKAKSFMDCMAFFYFCQG